MAIESHNQNRRIAGVAAGLLMALVGVAGVFLVGSRGARQAPGTAISSPVNVVVARGDLGRLSKLGPTNLAVERRPSAQLPMGSYFSAIDQVTGKYSAIDLKAETVLEPSFLLATPALAATAPTTVPLAIRDNYVAMAIPVDDQKGVGGYIQPDDHIDVIIDSTGKGSVSYMFQDVHVLKVGQAGQQAAAGGPVNLLVVELPRGQAEALSFLINGKGTAATVVRYVLRPVSQYAPLDQPPKYLPSGNPAAASSDPPLTPERFQSLFPG